MKKNLRTKAVLFVLLSRVDVVATVLDCVWLLVGIIPGVVALLIDVVTGGMYEAKLRNFALQVQ